MKIELVTLALVAAVSGASVQAKPPEHASDRGASVLKQGLKAVGAAAHEPPGQSNPKPDRDQGDDHASPTAIAKVCTKDTPAARRSAICDHFNSPN